MGLTAKELEALVAQRLGDHKLIVVSHREPYIHNRSGDRINCTIPAGGIVTALDPVLRACGGTWVAHGSGDADRDTVDEHDRILVPTDGPPDGHRYTLRRIWLSKKEEQDYYYGFANQGLWPLCHLAYTRPRFDDREWQTYCAVNERFAEAILEEAGNEPAFVFIQDYHFALLPRLLKDQRPDLIIAQFWHIPWPNPEIFRICPWSEDILRGLLANDILGFHIQYHCNNFFSVVERSIEAVVNYEQFCITSQGRTTLVRPFPISVDFEDIRTKSQSQSVADEADRLRRDLGLRQQIVGIGIDRLDYTKGIPERLKAIDRFLDKYSEYQGRFTFLQAGPISRIYVPEYKALNDELYHLMVDINRKYESDHWVPIRILKGNHTHQTVLALAKLADVCIVSSLHDGMNLVAKEFASSCRDDSMLILSKFTGASCELDAATLVNPYYPESFADAIREAIEMPSEEKVLRTHKMREAIAEHNVYDWAAKILTEIGRLG